MLKFIITDQADFDKLDDGSKKLYDEDGSGRWVLQVEGAVPKKQLDDFRETNIKLRKQVEAFGEITADEAKELKAKKAEFEAGNDPKKIEEIVTGRVADMKRQHETELASMKAENDRMKALRAQGIIDAAITEAGQKAGVKAAALPDLIARGRSVFQIGEDGESIICNDSHGQPVYVNGEKQTPGAWVGVMAKEAGHLFEPSNGGGSQSQQQRGTSGSGGKNPWARDTWNLTEQGRLVREDKANAQRMAAAHGYDIS